MNPLLVGLATGTVFLIWDYIWTTNQPRRPRTRLGYVAGVAVIVAAQVIVMIWF